MNELPKTINVMKVVSYDVEQIVQELIDWRDIEEKDITLKMVLEVVDKYVEDDFNTSRDYLLYQDENGNEIND